MIITVQKNVLSQRLVLNLLCSVLTMRRSNLLLHSFPFWHFCNLLYMSVNLMHLITDLSCRNYCADRDGMFSHIKSVYILQIVIFYLRPDTPWFIICFLIFLCPPLTCFFVLSFFLLFIVASDSLKGICNP